MLIPPIEVLRSTFGYPSFRSGQEEVVTAALSGRDVVAVMPTGGGKSLCYQVPAIVQGGLTLVISPLIALMKDQVDQLRSRGVAAHALHSGQERSDQSAIMAAAAAGSVPLLYVAPERLGSPAFSKFLASLPIRFVAVDEAHCISEWGHDFRPSYLDIPRMFNYMPRVPIIAVTATATPEVRADVVSVLGLRQPDVVVRGFDRPNLTLASFTTSAKADAVAAWTHAHPDAPAIVYAGSRRRVESFTYDLQQHGVNAQGYHAGMPQQVRSKAQDDFLGNRTAVLVASSAFGMGIDKPNIRHVFHVDLTLTLESYYQEAGRAGRDGQPAECTLLYHPDDRTLMEHFLRYTHPSIADVQSVTSYLRGFPGIEKGATPTLDVDAASLAASVGLPLAVVESVLRALERQGMILRMPPSTALYVTLDDTRDRLVHWASQAARAGNDWAPIADVLARSASRLVSSSAAVPFSLDDVSRKADVPPATVLRALQAMQNAGLIRFQAPQTTASITIVGNLDQLFGNAIALRERRRKQAFDKLDAVQRYAESRQCKRSIILQYFGDPMAHEPCGRCSSCKPSIPAWTKSTDGETLVNRMLSAVRIVLQIEGRYGRTVVADILHGRMTDRVRSIQAQRCLDFGVLGNEPSHVSHAVLDAAIARDYLRTSGGQYPLLEATASGRTFLGETPEVLSRPTYSQRSEKLSTLAHQGDVQDQSAWAVIVRGLRPHHTLAQAAYDAGVRPADVVSAIDRALTKGVAVARGKLIPDELYRMVKSIVIARRHATLRAILQELQPGTDVATARLALLFVRAELHTPTHP